MASYTVKVIDTEFITPDVKRFVVERPKGYTYEPGQATDVAIDKPGWTDQLRPFTFTGLPGAKHLEFIIKLYDGRGGVTHQLGLVHKNDQLILGEPFGAITYKGPGFFFAGGAGVTPFVAILRDLQKRKALAGNTLVCSNHTATDVILDEEFTKMLGKRFIKIFTRQRVIGFHERRIDRDLLVALVQDFDQYFYLCGPEDFVADMRRLLEELGAKAEALVFEQ
ncbi:MAG: flavodoxin reductase [Bacteroidetes bacterium]|nr:flavodoxin reductase [Bacteroidota bacterium]